MVLGCLFGSLVPDRLSEGHRGLFRTEQRKHRGGRQETSVRERFRHSEVRGRTSRGIGWGVSQGNRFIAVKGFFDSDNMNRQYELWWCSTSTSTMVGATSIEVLLYSWYDQAGSFGIHLFQGIHSIIRIDKLIGHLRSSLFMIPSCVWTTGLALKHSIAFSHISVSSSSSMRSMVDVRIVSETLIPVSWR